MKTFINVFVLLFFILMYSCYTTQEITTYQELSNLMTEENEEVMIVMKDTTIYSAKINSFTDSTISIKRSEQKDSELLELEDTLYFRNISYIQSKNYSFILGAVSVGATCIIVVSGLGVASPNEGVSSTITYIREERGGGGCSKKY